MESLEAPWRDRAIGWGREEKLLRRELRGGYLEWTEEGAARLSRVAGEVGRRDAGPRCQGRGEWGVSSGSEQPSCPGDCGAGAVKPAVSAQGQLAVGGGTGHRAAQAGQGCILPKRERKADVGGGGAPSRNLAVEGKVKVGVSGT